MFDSTYTRLASEPPQDQEKLVSESSIAAKTPKPATPPRRSFIRSFVLFTCSLLAILVLLASLYAVNYSLKSCSGSRPGHAVEGSQLGFKKRSTAEDSSPTFSTTTYSDGETSTFVYTTRPIVNPAGYTIGTLTGYVPLTTIVLTRTSTLRSTTTVPGSSSLSTSSTSSSTTIPVSSRTVLPRAAAEFPFDDSHLRHKRGLNLEEGEFGATPVPGKTEYSYELGAGGETVKTYVKTTRPIINPNGYQIGMLDGAYVAMPTATPTPTPPHFAHQELKKRQEDY